MRMPVDDPAQEGDRPRPAAVPHRPQRRLGHPDHPRAQGQRPGGVEPVADPARGDQVGPDPGLGQPADGRRRWGCPSPRRCARARRCRPGRRCDSTAIQEVPPAPDTSMAPTPAASSRRATAGEMPQPVSLTSTGRPSSRASRSMVAAAPRKSRSPPGWASSWPGLRWTQRASAPTRSMTSRTAPVDMLAELDHPEVGQQEDRGRGRPHLVGPGQVGPDHHRPLAAQAEGELQRLGGGGQIAVDGRRLLGAAGHAGDHQRGADGPAEQGGAQVDLARPPARAGTGG